MRVAWLFPGQGAQVVGMGKGVLDASPRARAVFAHADEALGEPLTRLILEGPEDQLTLTANAQPAIVTTSVAMLEAIRERYTDLSPPAFAVGHSLGEYSALVAAGGLTFEDAVRLVRARGKAMQEAVPAGSGAMAAIMGLDGQALSLLCERAASETGEVVSCANFNAPGQIVIAGSRTAVARVQELVSADKGKAIPLKVSAPFHCALMAPAARAVSAALERVPVNDLAFPVIANADAEPNVSGTRAKELLVRQVDGAVLWEQIVRFMHGQGVTHAIEVGPGKVLAGLVKRIARDLKVHSVSDPSSLEGLGSFLGG